MIKSLLKMTHKSAIWLRQRSSAFCRISGNNQRFFLLCVVLIFWTGDARALPWWDAFAGPSASGNDTSSPLNDPAASFSETLLTAASDPNSKESTLASPRFVFAGDYPVADWLNALQVGRFLDFSGKYVFSHDPCFVFFNLSQNISVWIEPYCFYSHYRSKLKQEQKMDFSLFSYGSHLGARWGVFSAFNLGGAIGYFHSDLRDKKIREKANINGLYFGPTAEYLLSEGALQLTLFGIKNYYSGPTSTGKGSWDIDLRLEGEYNYAFPSGFYISDFIIHPFVRIDYLNVFEESPTDNFAFFYSKLGLRFDKLVRYTEAVVITTNIDLGWVNMTPLSGGHVEYKGGSLDPRPFSKNQLALGAKCVGMHRNGLLIGLDYDLGLGADAPSQTGRVRAEWNW